jgi:hypothetical protein
VKELEEAVGVLDRLLVLFQRGRRRQLHPGQHSVHPEVLQQPEYDARQNVLGDAHEVNRRAGGLVRRGLGAVMLGTKAEEKNEEMSCFRGHG